MEIAQEVQKPIPLLSPQFPLTFDPQSFAEATLEELETELAALNSDLKTHFPTRK